MIVKRKRGRPRKDPNAPVVIKPKKEKVEGRKRGRPPKNPIVQDDSAITESPLQDSLVSEAVRQTFAEYNIFMRGVNTFSLQEVVLELIKDLELDMAMLSIGEQKYLHIHKRKAIIERMKQLL